MPGTATIQDVIQVALFIDEDATGGLVYAVTRPFYAFDGYAVAHTALGTGELVVWGMNALTSLPGIPAGTTGSILFTPIPFDGGTSGPGEISRAANHFDLFLASAVRGNPINLQVGQGLDVQTLGGFGPELARGAVVVYLKTPGVPIPATPLT